MSKKTNTGQNEKSKLVRIAIYFTLVIGVIVAIFLRSPTESPLSEKQSYVIYKNNSIEVFSKPYLIDQIFQPMKGPRSYQNFYLTKKSSPELLWITGYEVSAVDSVTQAPMLQDFICHNTLSKHHPSVSSLNHQNIPIEIYNMSHLFTMSSGQLSVSFPQGFGIPVRADQLFSLETQILNLNVADASLNVRQKTKISFVHDNAQNSYKPLFSRVAMSSKTLRDYSAHEESHGANPLGHSAG